MKRGAQWSMAACTRASGTGDHLLDARAEVLQQYDRGVAPRRAGDRAARMRGSAGLVETGNRHPVLRPTRRGPQRSALRQRPVPPVERAVDHVLVGALDVLWRPDERVEDHALAEVR